MKKTLAAVSIAASLTAMTACSSDPAPQSAPQPLAAAGAPAAKQAAKEVNCNGDSNGALTVSFHFTNSSDQLSKCFTGNGKVDVPDGTFTTSISTGNNTARFLADGREQPDGGQPIGKNKTQKIGPDGGAKVDQVILNP